MHGLPIMLVCFFERKPSGFLRGMFVHAHQILSAEFLADAMMCTFRQYGYAEGKKCGTQISRHPNGNEAWKPARSEPRWTQTRWGVVAGKEDAYHLFHQRMRYVVEASRKIRVVGAESFLLEDSWVPIALRCRASASSRSLPWESGAGMIAKMTGIKYSGTCRGRLPIAVDARQRNVEYSRLKRHTTEDTDQRFAVCNAI